MCDGGELAIRISSLGACMGRSWFGTRASAVMQRGCSCESSSVFTVLVQLIASLRTCLHGKIYQCNYPTVIIPG